MNNQIKTAVLPVAGLGTRFLPVTKSSPKEMLPIIDRPLIQYVVEEAIGAGITKIVFVTSSTKRSIEDYFDCNSELENQLEQKGKLHELRVIRDIIPSHVDIVYVRQKQPRGLGDAILSARPAVGDEPFAVLLPDDVMEHSSDACLKEMITVFNQTNSSVLGVQNVPRSETSKYGIVSLKNDEELRGGVVTGLIEKPQPQDAPTTLAIAGRYILTHKVFAELERTELGAGGELQLTDAIAKLLDSERVSTTLLSGERYDCGSRRGLLKATIDFALKRPDLRADILSYIEEKHLAVATN